MPKNLSLFIRSMVLPFFLFLFACASTSIWDAAQRGRTKTVESLLKKGKDPNIRDQQGKTPLIYSALTVFDNTKVVKLLLEKGADVNARDNYGTTPLMYAAICGNKYVTKQLIEYKPDVDAKQNGLSALNYAIFNLDIFMTTALSQKDREGRIDGYKTTIETLVTGGASANEGLPSGDTPLILVAKWGFSDLVRTLLVPVPMSIWSTMTAILHCMRLQRPLTTSCIRPKKLYTQATLDIKFFRMRKG